jgi:DNA-binding NarL/FixJ family response regulator
VVTKILIADDNVLIRRGLRALLQTHDGWEEETANSQSSRAPRWLATLC